MKIESEFDKCILCLEQPADSWEHIIPESIGGRLQIKALCSRCNNTPGSGLISNVRMSSDIRLCIQNLKREIPDLYESMKKGLPYLAKGNDNKLVKLIRKNGEFVVLSQQEEDGSIIYDSKKARKHIAKMLKKQGLPGHEIAEKIDSLKKRESGGTVRLSNNLRAANRETGPIELCFVDLREKRVLLLDERVIVLIAYEFLSLLAGKSIYDRCFDCVRAFIKGGDKSESLVIEHLRFLSCGPYHEIYPQLSNTEVVVTIILFGEMVYRVHVKNIKLPSPDFVYAENLRNKKSLLAKSVEDAKRANCYEF